MRVHALHPIHAHAARAALIASLVIALLAFNSASSVAAQADATPASSQQEESVNNAPVAGDDVFSSGANAGLTLNLLANDLDPDGDFLSIVGLDDPTSLGGNVIDNGDGSVDYIAPNAGGTDTFTYTISDGELTDNATVSISVSDPPPMPTPTPTIKAPKLINGILLFSVVKGQSLFVPAPGLFNNVSNPDNFPVELSPGILPENGELTSFNEDGSFTYIPNKDFEGTERFTYFMSANVTNAAGEVTSGIVEGRVEILVVEHAPLETPQSTVIAGVEETPQQLPKAGNSPMSSGGNGLIIAIVLACAFCGTGLLARRAARLI